jgi:hypothetical protein
LVFEEQVFHVIVNFFHRLLLWRGAGSFSLYQEVLHYYLLP